MNRDNIFGENARMYAREPLFQNPPERIAQSRMSRFAAALEDYTGERFADYPALHAYSVREYRRFWQCFLHWSRPASATFARAPVSFRTSR
jgi:acetoacetyl-CoA synthetase